MGSLIICKVLCSVQGTKMLVRKLLQSVTRETILDWMFEPNKVYLCRIEMYCIYVSKTYKSNCYVKLNLPRTKWYFGIVQLHE